MEKFAVVSINKNQYKVSEGDILSVDLLANKPEEKLTFDEVLLVFEDGKLSLGTPTVDKAKVQAEVLEHYQGQKVVSSTYKAKARTRRKVASRPQLTKIKILKIN